MESKLFPAAIIQNTVEIYDSRISVRSRFIYLIFLGILLGVVMAMPLIYVDVAVQSRGTFQSSLQRNPILNTANGKLETWNLSENKKVKKGDILAIIRGEQINLEMKGLEERSELLQEFIRDLRHLVKMDFSIPLEASSPHTNFYQASFFEFQAQLLNQEMLVQKIDRDFQRAKTLFESKSISFAEYDEVQIQYQQAKTQLELLQKQKINQWQQDLFTYTNERDRILNQLEVSKEQLDQYRIIAGTSGTLMNVLNLNVGDFVYPNQKLAEISPDSTLLAVTYLSPSDIAFIRKGQEVKFQVDAYNYNQWGVVTGKVHEMADDLTLINEKEAGFLITCTLDDLFLVLPSGQKGKIKKGMTFNSRYVVARRSLLQLLYDKVDDWLNPMVNTKS